MEHPHDPYGPFGGIVHDEIRVERPEFHRKIGEIPAGVPDTRTLAEKANCFSQFCLYLVRGVDVLSRYTTRSHRGRRGLLEKEQL
jgi:hypothetical protein